MHGNIRGDNCGIWLGYTRDLHGIEASKKEEKPTRFCQSHPFLLVDPNSVPLRSSGVPCWLFYVGVAAAGAWCVRLSAPPCAPLFGPCVCVRRPSVGQPFPPCLIYFVEVPPRRAPQGLEFLAFICSEPHLFRPHFFWPHLRWAQSTSPNRFLSPTGRM